MLQGFCSSTSHQMGTFAGFPMLSTTKLNTKVKAKNVFIKRGLSKNTQLDFCVELSKRDFPPQGKSLPRKMPLEKETLKQWSRTRKLKRAYPHATSLTTF